MGRYTLGTLLVLTCPLTFLPGISEWWGTTF
jgi:hypothetical protein